MKKSDKLKTIITFAVQKHKAMHKYIYVLTSKETDFYYEQFLLSLTSLKMRTPQASASVLTDDKTAATLIGKRTAYKELIDEIKVVDFPTDTNSFYRSRYLKTKMRELIKGDFLYIDVDTVVVDDLSDIGDIRGDIAAVKDRHCALSKFEHRLLSNYLRRAATLQFEVAGDIDIIYNGGVIFAKDNDFAREFFQKWHELWLFSVSRGVYLDQPALKQANFLMNHPIVELSGEWNCLISAPNSLQYLTNAKIVHYIYSCISNNYIDPIYLPSDEQALRQIKETGSIPEEIKAMLLKNPCHHFTDDIYLTRKSAIDTNDMRFLSSWTLIGEVRKRALSKIWRK
jgi:hypothetical protein